MPRFLPNRVLSGLLASLLIAPAACAQTPAQPAAAGAVVEQSGLRKVADRTPTQTEPRQADPEPAASKPAESAQDAPTPAPNAATGPLASAWGAWKRGDGLAARAAANALLRTSAATSTDHAEARRLLSAIADDTLFAGRPLEGDALTEWYTVRRGDVLAKIARRAKLQTAALVLVNRLGDPGSLQVGQRLLVPQGPFDAIVYKSAYRMDLYLRDQFVRSYPVGLGTDNGTPTGKWRVKTTLANPTYYPPETAPDRRVIGPNDPNNPLGEYWIGLEGIEGAAVGRRGFGIHGTIEPDSIGRDASLGCIRLHNDDVAVVFKLLVDNASTVTIAP